MTHKHLVGWAGGVLFSRLRLPRHAASKLRSGVRLIVYGEFVIPLCGEVARARIFCDFRSDRPPDVRDIPGALKNSRLQLFCPLN